MTDKKVSGEAENIYRYTAYEYDGFNRLTGVSECDTSEIPSAETIAANKVSYTYNSKDKLTAIDYPDCALGVKGLRFEYNIHGWLAGIKAVNKSGFEKDLRDYTYTDDGKVGEITDYTDFLSGKSKRLTKNQKDGFPELKSSGGTVVGRGKGKFKGGTVIPATNVKVIRP